MAFIKGIASLGAAMLIGLYAPSAQAGYVVDLTQQGSNVVATGSGPIDLTGLTFDGTPLAGTFIYPALGAIVTGITSVQRPVWRDDWTSEFRERIRQLSG